MIPVDSFNVRPIDLYAAAALPRAQTLASDMMGWTGAGADDDWRRTVAALAFDMAEAMMAEREKRAVAARAARQERS